MIVTFSKRLCQRKYDRDSGDGPSSAAGNDAFDVEGETGDFGAATKLLRDFWLDVEF